MKLFVLCIAGILLLGPSSRIVAQQSTSQPVAQPATTQNEGSALVAVPAGEDLLIETKTGETIKGKFVSVKDSTLTLSRNNKPVTIELPQVQKVYRLVGRTRKKSAAVGAVSGALAGLGIGLGLHLPDSNDIVGAVVPGLAVIGAGIGAAIGAGVGRGRKKILIYEAK